MPVEKLEISWRSAARFFAVGAVALGIYFFRDLIAMFISAIVIATVAEGPVKRLARRGWPRFASVALIYLGGLGIIVGLAYLLTPIISREFQGATATLLQVLERVFRSERLVSDIAQVIQGNLLGSIQSLGGGAGTAFNFVYRLGGGAFSVIVTFVISFYLALQGQTIERLIKALVREDRHDYFLNLWIRSERKIDRWFYGQMLLSFFVGLFVFIGLWILGVNYAFIVGLAAAAFEIVPVAGPLMAATLAVIIAAHQGFNLAIYTLIMFVIIQQIESNIFVPAVMKRSTGLNPIVVVFALLIGGKVAGFWGILLAVPVTSALSELFQDWEEKKIPA